jgi:hypothetical protein
MATLLTDKINALTAYANEVTGESDTTLSEAVHTLADGYGQGGGGDSIWNTIVDRTVTEANDKDGLCKTVGQYAFYGCASLTSAIFPSVTSIRNNAFSGCSKLPSVDLPSATSIGTSAFFGCSKLPSVDLPSATSIGSSAFSQCSALKSLILRKSDAICTLSSNNAFTSTPIKGGTGYIYVPSALIETYKTANKWSTFAAQFRALEDYTVDGTITGDLDPNKI